MLKVLKSVNLVVVGQTYGIRAAGDCRRARDRARDSSEGSGERGRRLPSSVDPLDPARATSLLRLVSTLA